jgi:hypothetical protein
MIILVILILGFAGFIYYELNSPFSINGVEIQESIEIYNKETTELMNGYLVIKGGEEIIDNCYYTTYNPESSLNNVYVCQPKKGNSLDLWMDKVTDFYIEGGIQFSKGDIEINSEEVKTITLSDQNCGNPGYCTSYFWTQGKIIFKSNTKELVEGFIEVNKGMF